MVLPQDEWQSPLASRYASVEMRTLFSDRNRIGLWRRLWLALAESEHELGLPITAQQLDELRNTLDDIDFEKAAAYEAELRHDVMAHVHTWGDVAPTARPILHLGATSQFLNCNAEAIMLRDALDQIAGTLAAVIDALGTFACTHRAVPTLGSTHFQTAQPTTVGKRASVWCWDLCLALEEVERQRDGIRLRGVKGTTGTQASFLALFDGDHDKVDQLENMVAERMGFTADQLHPVTGQTYPRLVDAKVLSALGIVATASHKWATDVRLLAGRAEIEEPVAKKQIGSSAMPYKRNPMRCERACGLARFVMNLVPNTYQTAATQWLERTLDDSANRRLALSEAFLATDATLGILRNVSKGLIANPAVCRTNLMREMPFLATEALLMAAVRQGADRQTTHEVIRSHSREVQADLRAGATTNDLLDRLRTEPAFDGVSMEEALEPERHIGRAPEQVDRFIGQYVTPIRHRYASNIEGDVSDLAI
ncbi:MAG: adenylosuccinate lyase [Phycisphaerae bacterium]|nr:adenylosuccinate lyase [Phycisphaerae bacterium]